MKNKSAFPFVSDKGYIEHGITKLEWLTGMALQGILACTRDFAGGDDAAGRVTKAIEHAKEAIKQLEAEQK